MSALDCFMCDVRAFSLDKALELDATFLDDDDDHTHDPSIKARVHMGRFGPRGPIWA